MSSVLIDGIPMISPSQSATLIDCERRWWFRYQRGLGKDERTEPLAMGGGLAAALEYGSHYAGRAEYLERRPDTDVFTDPEVDHRNQWIAHATIREAFKGYTDRWSEEGVTREQTYVLGIPGSPRALQVRVDGIGPGHLIEDKLRSASSMRDADIENEIRQGFQLTAEIYAQWRITGELWPVHLRCIKKIDPRKVKKLETQAQVDEVMAAHFAGDGVFHEWTAERTVEQLEQFEVEITDLARRADELAASAVPAGRRNTKACHAYGRTCPALAICQGLATEAEVIAA